MNEMILPSRHGIRNAVWGRAPYLSVTQAPHNIEFLQVSGVKQFVSLKLRTRYRRLSKQAVLSTLHGSFCLVVARNTAFESQPDICHQDCAYTVFQMNSLITILYQPIILLMYNPVVKISHLSQSKGAENF